MNNNFLKEGVDYSFLDNIKDYETTPVKILTGKYKDVIVCFGKIRIVETDEHGNGILGFTFKIVSNENFIKYHRLNNDKKFKNHLGKILDSVIVESVDSANEDGGSYNQEPDERQRVWQEGSSISKE